VTNLKTNPQFTSIKPGLVAIPVSLPKEQYTVFCGT